jgi:pimeloyl-ACP methyl ester carboxylesterase
VAIANSVSHIDNTRFLETPDGVLAYDDEGSGPLVVMMTGMGDLRSQYRFARRDLLAAGFRVVTVDARGFGESSAAWPDFSRAAIAGDYLALVRHLGGRPAVLVASSYVGGAAAWASVLEPDLVSGIVLLGGFIREAEPTLSSRMLKRFMASPISRGMWPSYYASLYTSAKPADLDSHVAAVRKNLAEPGRWRALGRMVLADNTATDARAGEVTAPALVVVGSADPDFMNPAEEIDYAQRSFAGPVEGLLVDGAGHYPHVERPDVVSPRLISFLRSACPAKA